MIAVGLDIGGTKIEAQAFAEDWSLTDRLRVETPATYPEFLDAICQQVHRISGAAEASCPVGISIAGLSNPATGLFLAANLPASQKPLHADLEAALGRSVTLINDARAFTQSEAVFGAAERERIVAGVILGTGVGGGLVIDNQLHSGLHAMAGEFGHMAAPSNVLVQMGLPLLPCGCGRIGCIETLASGPGLSRISAAMTGQSRSPEDIALQRHGSAEVKEVWQAWCLLVAELLVGISLCVEPEVFILGGGLSKIPGLVDDLSEALARRHIVTGTSLAIRLAEGGDALGARGAAYAAWRAVEQGR